MLDADRIGAVGRQVSGLWEPVEEIVAEVPVGFGEVGQQVVGQVLGSVAREFTLDVFDQWLPSRLRRGGVEEGWRSWSGVSM